VLVLTLLAVSALVLWHEHRVLNDELEVQGDLLARLLALSAADGGSPEYLAVLTMTDLTAGEVRSVDGEVMWRYGPPLDEITPIAGPQLRVDRRVEVAAGPWGQRQAFDVSLLMSRSRLQGSLAGAAVRLVVALAFALAIAMTVGLWMVGRVVEPLAELAELSRSFDPREPLEVSPVGRGVAELAELAAAFREMTRRLSEQQRSLVASERRFRELFASSPTPLLELDRETRIRGANPAAVAFLGAEPGAVAGRPLGAFTVDAPDRLAGSTTSAGESVVETRWRMPDGDLAEVELHLRSAGDAGHLIASIHDLTDRVRRLGERWQRTFDAMIDGVALVADDAGVVVANRALAPHLPALGPEVLARAAAEGSWRTRSLDRLLECNLSRPGGLEHAILVVRDITEAVSAEARLREAGKMQAVATLASGVAHDFNNLLAAVQLHLRLIEAEPERAGEAVAAIRDLAEQGSEVVSELLLFARSDSSAAPQTLDLVSLVSEQRTVLNHLLPDGVELEVKTGDGAPVPVVGNPVALRRLLLNLVVNARDAVASDGGTITVSVGRRGGRAELEVADTGPGIADEIRDRLFEPFFTLRRRGRGAGLGLAVVYAVASAHGGEVELVSGAGEGARFVVRLPPGDIAELAGADHDDPAAQAGRGARVLLVEPDGRAAAAILERLAEAGHDVRHAPGVGAARRIAAGWPPAAVVARPDDRAAAEWSVGAGLPLVTAPPTAAATDAVLARLAELAGAAEIG
jgi:PAS domain S-box-containing protein